MKDDFKEYIRDYKKSPEGIKRQSNRNKKRKSMLLFLLIGFFLSYLFPPLFIFWFIYLIFLFFYSIREWIG